VDGPYLGRDRLKAALDGVCGPELKILLAHAPTIFPKAEKRH
jgi:hypothetical protein